MDSAAPVLAITALIGANICVAILIAAAVFCLRNAAKLNKLI